MQKVFFIIVCALLMFSFVYGGDFTYVGSQKCKMCHKGAKKGEVWEKWEASPHAKALETLKAKGEEKNAACLECHVTAFNTGGYVVDDANAAKFEGVGCESCHGPGSAYKSMKIMKDQKLAIENGMVVPTEETCKKCHNEKSPTFKGFDFAEYYKKIDHKYTK